MKKYILEITVFTSGAIVMIFEMVGSRIFAPYIGSSLVVWTSLIGVILAALSYGYNLGGKLADRKPNYKFLSFLILFSALSLASCLMFKDDVLYLLQIYVNNLPLSSIIATTLLFAPGSIFFGMISPYAIRLKLEKIESSGEAVGRMYAISTLGSIIGTFLSGFYLIPMFGTSKILIILSVILFLLSILVYKENVTKKEKFFGLFSGLLFLIIFVGIGKSTFADNSNIVEVETLYNHVKIIDSVDREVDRPVRYLMTDPMGVQGAEYTDGKGGLAMDYGKYYDLVDIFKSDINNALFIGGGTYSYPRHFLELHNEAEVEIVEIDAALTELSKKYFGLKDDPRMKIYHEDGRTFLNRLNKKFDVVYLDAFNSHISVPFQLATKEAVEGIYDALKEDGVLLMNMITALEGENSKFLRAELATYKTIFPHVYLFQVKNDFSYDKIQNVILVASKNQGRTELKSDDENFQRMLLDIYDKDIELDLPVLTDDYAPVDFYMMGIHNLK